MITLYKVDNDRVVVLDNVLSIEKETGNTLDGQRLYCIKFHFIEKRSITLNMVNQDDRDKRFDEILNEFSKERITGIK